MAQVPELSHGRYKRIFGVLFQLTKLVNSGAGLPELLRAVAANAVELVGADTCSIMLLDEGRSELLCKASFGLPEPLVGAIALGGGLHRLAREIGPKQAMGMILTARRVSAAEGYRLGFVNEVVAPGDLDAAVTRWCAEIVRGAPPALRASKEVVYRGLDEPSLPAALANQSGYPAFVAWRASDDAREGPLAFAEKRAPNWVGR